MIDFNEIEAARKRLKVKKGAIAKATGIPARRIGDILKGRSDPRVKEMERICKEVGLTLSILPV